MYTIPDTTTPLKENSLIQGVAKLFDRHEDPMIRAASFNGQASIQLVEDNIKMLREHLKTIEDFNKEFTAEDERRFLSLCASTFEVRRIWKELDDEMHPAGQSTKKDEV